MLFRSLGMRTDEEDARSRRSMRDHTESTVSYVCQDARSFRMVLSCHAKQHSAKLCHYINPFSSCDSIEVFSGSDEVILISSVHCQGGSSDATSLHSTCPQAIAHARGTHGAPGVDADLLHVSAYCEAESMIQRLKEPGTS
mgnify:CR=1 FL=1